MTKLEQTDKHLIDIVSGITDYDNFTGSIRRDGESLGLKSNEWVTITPKKDKQGIDIVVKPFAPKQTIQIPAIVTKSGYTEVVYNDFEIGEGSEIVIVAGCGICNNGDQEAKHDGVHSFHLGKNSKVVYNEIHYGEGNPQSPRLLNPRACYVLEDGANLEINSSQIAGVNSTNRVTEITLGANAQAIINEKLSTDKTQVANSIVEVRLEGKGSSTRVISRSVAKGNSKQKFNLKAVGLEECYAHMQCDSIIMDSANVCSIPECNALHTDAKLVHEATIGRIAGEQLIKLMSLGLTEESAEEVILNGFLK